ncbi:hypothetical protein PR202_ga25948 [Eleusine coracana subsp. coracana]|uniref:Uncharacterized protein n=1 Tax=Eleusine coracana subsp. coracana TaxID=191504 RepID=A0AAV5DCD3_ELECO|nr:hypothetical protein PR202_ga25948 [Eleusine coracana subsp. coracana]
MPDTATKPSTTAPAVPPPPPPSPPPHPPHNVCFSNSRASAATASRTTATARPRSAMSNTPLCSRLPPMACRTSKSRARSLESIKWGVTLLLLSTRRETELDEERRA